MFVRRRQCTRSKWLGSEFKFCEFARYLRYEKTSDCISDAVGVSVRTAFLKNPKTMLVTTTVGYSRGSHLLKNSLPRI